MRASCTDRPRYTGAPMFPFAPGGQHPHGDGGFCNSCCHPRRACMCGQRECRREAKELLANSDTGNLANIGNYYPTRVLLLTDSLSPKDQVITPAVEAQRSEIIGKSTVAKAFIGGGCCVHLSVEYMANNPAQPSIIIIGVVDSESTGLIWERTDPAGTPYQVKEGIITTKPGAKLTLVVNNATARVRWCEVFSC
ncbi:MAG TPA: hypothetical protein VF378_05450 [Geothrix sp.]